MVNFLKGLGRRRSKDFPSPGGFEAERERKKLLKEEEEEERRREAQKEAERKRKLVPRNIRELIKKEKLISKRRVVSIGDKKPSRLFTQEIGTRMQNGFIEVGKKLTIKQARRELGTIRRLQKEERKGRESLRIVRRRRSISGRIGSVIESGFKLGQKGLTRTLIERDQPRRQISRVTRISKAGGVRTGKRGRPKGTVTFQDPRTGRPIGVFEHRKILAQQRRLQLIQARRQAAVTPRQQVVLRQLEQRDRRQAMSAEGRVTPGTSGQVNIMGIMDEIDSAANLVS